MEVIQFVDPTGRTLVARVPRQGTAEIRLGSELLVDEGQQAVFFAGGKALDAFGPGRHRLTAAGLPFVSRTLEPPAGGEPFFRAAVIFLSLQTFTDLKWGTREPLVYRDPELSVVRLRAFGTLAVRIADPRRLVDQLVGIRGIHTTDGLEGHLRETVVGRLTEVVGARLSSVFDLPAVHEELGRVLAAKVTDDLSQLGIERVDLAVLGIKAPKEVQKRIDERGPAAAPAKPSPPPEKRPPAAPPSGAGPSPAGTAVSPVHSPAAEAEQMAGPITFCQQCGHQLPADARYCPACGARVSRR